MNNSTDRGTRTAKNPERPARQQKYTNLNSRGCDTLMVRVQKPILTPVRLVRPLFIVAGMFYLGYHAMHGERGLYALVREQHEKAVLEQELAKTKAEREKVELRVSHLRDGSLDLDLLDEQMRRMLGVMKPGEIVVLTNRQDN